MKHIKLFNEGNEVPKKKVIRKPKAPKKPTFTFKTRKPVGKWKAFEKPSHYILLDKKMCGMISAEGFQIKFMVTKNDIAEDGNTNCTWKWIALGKKSTTLEEAQNFVKANEDILMNKYKINCSDTNPW